MPHLVVKMYPGRSEEIKKKLAEALHKTTVEELNCPAGAVSVSVEDIEKENWQAEVLDAIPAEEMFIEPDY